MQVGTFEQIKEQFRNGTYDLTDNGKCKQCGGCCSNLLPMTDEEIETIRKYIRRYHIKEHKHILPLANPILDLTCPFLNDSKKTEKCEIYSVRPKICQDFICCPSKRPPLDMELGMKARLVNVRSTFYGKA